MTGEQFHLLINHLPIVGALIGLILVGFSFFRPRDLGVLYAATLVLAISAAGGVAAERSGEHAEHAMEERPGFNHDAIEEHEDGAKLAAVLLLVTAAAAGGLSVLAARGRPVPMAGRVVLVLLNLMATAAMVNMGFTGRIIAHPEVFGAPTAEEPGPD